MSANRSPVFELKPLTDAPTQFQTTDGTGKKTVVTAAADSSRVDSISCCNGDTAAVSLNFYLSNGVVDSYIGTVAIAAGAGYTTVSKVDAITTLSPTLGFLWVPSGWTLKAACNVAMTTAGKILDVMPIGGVFS